MKYGVLVFSFFVVGACAPVCGAVSMGAGGSGGVSVVDASDDSPVLDCMPKSSEAGAQDYCTTSVPCYDENVNTGGVSVDCTNLLTPRVNGALCSYFTCFGYSFGVNPPGYCVYEDVFPCTTTPAACGSTTCSTDADCFQGADALTGARVICYQKEGKCVIAPTDGGRCDI